MLKRIIKMIIDARQRFESKAKIQQIYKLLKDRAQARKLRQEDAERFAKYYSTRNEKLDD